MPNNEYENEPNQSRSEDIISSILDGTEYDEPARSRIEYLLIQLKEAIEGGGGGGGVTSYSPLTEKPKIDNHTLQAGNNASSDLGLQTKIDADHKLSADNVDDTNSTNKFNVKSDWNAASGAAAEILNKPTLGTASAKNVPASGDAATGEVVLGSDTRLTDARNAKDVYNWAKQANKPTYSYSEIQNTPTIPDELKDLTDDATHRTVTDTEKSTWSGKQNALTFDDAPTNGSSNPVKSGGVYTALSGKQASLDETQMAAVNSGINSTKVAQIETNKNNILSISDQRTIYNLSQFATGTASSDGVTIASGIPITIPAGDYYVAYDTTAASGTTTVGFKDSGNSNVVVVEVGNGAKLKQFTVPNNNAVAFNVYVGKAGTYSNFRIIPKSLYDAGFTAFQPYAMSNVDLTAATKQNQTNILSQKTKGYLQKNLSKDNSLSDTRWIEPEMDNLYPAGNYVLYCGTITSADTTATTCAVVALAADKSTTVSTTAQINRSNGSYIAFTANNNFKYVRIYASSTGTASTGKAISATDIMVCTAADWTESQVYQPYAMSNVDLTTNVVSNSSDIASNWNSGKNKIRVGFTSKTYNTIAITNNGDGTVTINGTNSASSEGVGLADIQSDASTMYDTRFTLPEGTYHLYVQDDNSVVFGVQVYAHNGSNANVKLIQSNTGGDFTYNNSSTYPYIAIRLIMGGAQTYNNFKIYPMICEKSIWDASHKFEQYALSNVELTTNISLLWSTLIAIPNVSTFNWGSLTHTENVGTITINGTVGASAAFIGFPISLPAGTYKFSGCPSGGDTNTYYTSIRDSLGGTTYASETGSGGTFTLSASQTVWYNIRLGANYTATNLVFKPLIQIQ